MYFLDTDREDFEIRLGLNMPTYLSDGNLYPAYKILNDSKNGLLNVLTGYLNVSTSHLNSLPTRLMNQTARKPNGRKIRPQPTSSGKRALPTKFLTKYSLKKLAIKKEMVKKKALKRSNLLAVDPQRKYSKRQLKPSVVDSRDGKKL